ncbi:MAG: alpha-glucan family phosphorylase [Acidobacteriota bacterium]
MNSERKIAYFSMEIGMEAEMPTYSGGLGVLAGDTIRSGADLKIPMIGISLIHRKGYFYQRLDEHGNQVEEPVEWVDNDFLRELPQRVAIILEGRTVQIRAWLYEVTGVSGFKVPVYFLDADLPENSEWDRRLTDYLYGGDKHYRLCQEAILGIGGVRMVRALGYKSIDRFHMNEGHASLLALELLNEEANKAGRKNITIEDVQAVRTKCVFTTHTPIPAGHDKFPMDLVEGVLGNQDLFQMKEIFCCEGLLNMTYLALNLSHYVNGVAKRHGEVSRLMFADYNIDSITNGVHAITWIAPPFKDVYDRHIPGWRQDNFSFRYALGIPREEIWQAHCQAKKQLIHYTNHAANVGMDVDFFTIGFARRAAEYKRGDLLFYDINRLRQIAAECGPIQLIYAGKAHPQDNAGKQIIKRIYQAKEELKGHIKLAYLENYNMELAQMLTAGVDLWLNTPQPPMEASGTSGMKAAFNGIPSLSVLDGWWLEGHIEGVTGWSIEANGWGEEQNSDREKDALSLYHKLEHVVLPLFYQNRDRYIDVMLHCIALNASFFNSHRMLQQYVINAYL